MILTKRLIEDTLTLMDAIDQTEEFGGCYLWTGYTKSGQPAKGGRLMRRVVWEAGNGPMPAGRWISTCKHPHCLAHLRLVTRAQITSATTKNPATRLKRRAASARANREVNGKITMDIAKEMRASEKSNKEWAEELKVSPALVSNVRCNRSWVDHSNPFAGLMR